ncbi:hypothetical protein LIER_28052 [Lithospermum erythrorhizon]|uniref:MORF/ORRM1/DAG-like MORF domain-containing protein n=1 Tax=Lithospermum erythrorhizon TaxID=34254 RepID=A0AAV3RE73_LITER
MATLKLSFLTKPRPPYPHLQTHPTPPFFLLSLPSPYSLPNPTKPFNHSSTQLRLPLIKAASDRSNNNGEQRESIMLPGCDYNHWLIVMDFPKDPAPTREQMIDTYLNTLATVLGSMEEAKKNMYAFSTTTYTGFQCTVDEETSEKFKGLPGVLWVLPDSYIDVKNKDYGGDKYVNGEIIPCTYPTYQPKQSNRPKYKSKAYVRQRDGPPARRSKQEATSESATPESSP